MFTLAQPNTTTDAMRDVLANTLIDLAKQDKRIVVFDADLLSASGLKAFQNAYPQRTVNCGIQEGNMVGVAAGVSESGLIPFTHTFSSFAGRKCIDQAFISVCYAGLNVKMIGSDGGVTATTNGGTHQGMEDMGLFRSIPNITIVELTDANMIESPRSSPRTTPAISVSGDAAPMPYTPPVLSLSWARATCWWTAPMPPSSPAASR